MIWLWLTMMGLFVLGHVMRCKCGCLVKNPAIPTKPDAGER